MTLYKILDKCRLADSNCNINFRRIASNFKNKWNIIFSKTKCDFTSRLIQRDKNYLSKLNKNANKDKSKKIKR